MNRYLRSSEGLTLVALVCLALFLFLLPLGHLARLAVTTDNSLDLDPILDALNSRSVPRALWNSLESSLLSALLSLAVGTIAALAVGLTDMRGKAVLTFFLLIPMMIPPHVTAIAWIQAMGPSSPLLKTLGLAPEIGSTHPLYSRGGIVYLLGVQNMPLVFIVVLAAIRSLPREISDAARVSGARPVYLLYRIVLPLLAPTLIVGFALAFISALGNFGIPALLGIPARYITMPVLMWQRLASFGPSVLTDVAVVAAILAVVAITAIALQTHFMKRYKNRLIGPPQPPLRLVLGRARLPIEFSFVLLLIAILFLPLAALVATALVRTYGLPLTPETLTFSNFLEVLFRQSVTARAFLNSTLVALTAGIVLAGICIFLARFLNSPVSLARRMGHGMATLAEVSYAIPGLVISIAFIIAFIRPLPILGISLYGTLGIIFLAYLCAFFAIALKPIGAASQQLDPALDEAAQIHGARYFYRMRRVHFPLVAPAAASGIILVFLIAYNEVTVSALLWSTGNETIGTTIYNYEDGGYTTLAAAMSSVTVLATIVLMIGLDRLSPYVPRGVIPWRL